MALAALTEGVVVLHTSLGDILIELWRRECPKAVRNFVQLCLEGHYDGVPFHRIVPGFIAQTGGSDECIYDEGSFGIETNQVTGLARSASTKGRLSDAHMHANSASNSTAEDSSPWPQIQPRKPTRRSLSGFPFIRP